MYIQLNEQNQYLRTLPSGNIEFSDTVFQPAHTLTPEQAEQFRVYPLTPAEAPAYDPITHAVRPADHALIDGQWVQQWEVYALPSEEVTANQDAATKAAWERIMAERDRRKFAGVKVGAHWFHSDDSSRIQQLALVMMGSAIPAGLMWKTLTLTPPPVFEEMTPALASSIFQATVAQDAAIFAAAEAHRVAMEASSSPQDYDCTGGWPVSIKDEQ